MSTTDATILRLAPAVRYEPCAEFHADLTDPEVCAGCGWTGEDHIPAAA